MRELSIFILILVAIAMIFTVWVGLAGLGVERTLLNDDYYETLFAETGLVSIVHAEIESRLPEVIIAQQSEEMIPAVAAGLTEEERLVIEARLTAIFEAVGQVYDADWLEGQLLVAIEDILRLVKGEQDHLSATIDLSERRPQLVAILAEELAAIPGDMGREEDIPPELIELLAAEITAEAIPDRVELSELIGVNGLAPELRQTLDRLSIYRFLYLFGAWALFGLLLICNIALAGLAGGFKWSGLATAFSGFTFLAALLLLWAIYPAFLLGAAAAELPLPEKALQAAFSHSVRFLLPIPLACTVVGLTLFGAGLIAGSRTRRKRRRASTR